LLERFCDGVNHAQLFACAPSEQSNCVAVPEITIGHPRANQFFTLAYSPLSLGSPSRLRCRLGEPSDIAQLEKLICPGIRKAEPRFTLLDLPAASLIQAALGVKKICF
jgi:hypothetical protein